MLKNELKVLTTSAQTLVYDERIPVVVKSVRFYNIDGTATTFDLSLTDKAGTTIYLRKDKDTTAVSGEATTIVEDVVTDIYLEAGDKLEALASVNSKVHVLVNYVQYNGSPIGL